MTARIIKPMTAGARKPRVTVRELGRMLAVDVLRTAAYVGLPIVASAVGAVGWTLINGSPSADGGVNFGFGAGILCFVGMSAGVVLALWAGFREMHKADLVRAAKAQSQ